MQNSCEFFVYFLSFLQMEAQVLGWDVLQCRYKTQNSGVKVKAKQRQAKSDKKWLFWQLLIGALLSMHNSNSQKCAQFSCWQYAAWDRASDFIFNHLRSSLKRFPLSILILLGIISDGTIVSSKFTRIETRILKGSWLDSFILVTILDWLAAPCGQREQC